MAYPGMSEQEFYNANISILACQLFVMMISLIVSIAVRKAAGKPATKT